jgi:hypothetical protein
MHQRKTKSFPGEQFLSRTLDPDTPAAYKQAASVALLPAIRQPPRGDRRIRQSKNPVYPIPLSKNQSQPHYNIMTRTSIEACAKVFVFALFLMFLYSVYRVAGMIGWF